MKQKLYLKKYNLFFAKNEFPACICLLFPVYYQSCDMIAVKREVAAVPDTAGFPWSECQVIETGDKSLYKILMVRK